MDFQIHLLINRFCHIRNLGIPINRFKTLRTVHFDFERTRSNISKRFASQMPPDLAVKGQFQSGNCQPPATGDVYLRQWPRFPRRRQAVSSSGTLKQIISENVRNWILMIWLRDLHPVCTKCIDSHFSRTKLRVCQFLVIHTGSIYIQWRIPYIAKETYGSIL